jgi:hypothetical protein
VRQSLLDINEERFEREGQVPFSGFALCLFYCLKSLKKYRISFFIRIFANLKHRGAQSPNINNV